MKIKLKKRLRTIFNQYKRKLNLRTKLLFVSEHLPNIMFSFTVPDNTIICSLTVANQFQKELLQDKRNYIVCSEKFESSDFEEVLCYNLLHEIGHALDYKLHRYRVLLDSLNYCVKKSALQHFKHPLEKIANKFAEREIKKFSY
jgi:hypothetical protein